MSERQYDHEYYLKHRDRILSRMKSYYRAHREETCSRQKLYKNFDRVQYCKLMIKRWEKKLKEAEADENGDL